MEDEVVHSGVGTRGPTCPVCGGETKWLTEADAATIYYKCVDCGRIFNWYLDTCVWWPESNSYEPKARRGNR